MNAFIKRLVQLHTIFRQWLSHLTCQWTNLKTLSVLTFKNS